MKAECFSDNRGVYKTSKVPVKSITWEDLDGKGVWYFFLRDLFLLFTFVFYTFAKSRTYIKQPLAISQLEHSLHNLKSWKYDLSIFINTEIRSHYHCS